MIDSDLFQNQSLLRLKSPPPNRNADEMVNCAVMVAFYDAFFSCVLNIIKQHLPR